MRRMITRLKNSVTLLKTGIAPIVGTLVAAILFSGCLKSDTPPPSNPKTYISLLHLAPTGPALDVYFNESKVSNAPFTPGSITSGYNAVDKGNYTVRFKKATSDSLVTEIPFAQYDSLAFYSIFLYNEQENGPVHALRIKDDFLGLENTKPYYRFFHGSPNTGAIDIYIDNVLLESDRTAADNVGMNILNKFTAISSGHHVIDVKLAGTDTVIATLNTEFIPGNAYTLYLKGLENGVDNNKLTLGVLRAS